MSTEIYCVDMTQLIAAGSHIALPGTVKHLGLRLGTDPKAAASLECLATILCNDTLVHFQPPKVLP